MPLFVGIMAVASALLSLTTLHGWGTLRPSLVLLFAALFAVAGVAKIKLEFRKQTWALSLADIPLVIGLFLLQPAAVLVARLIGWILHLAWWKTSPVKAAFNLVLASLEVGVVANVFWAIGGAAAGEPRNWLAAIVAVLVMNAVGACAVYTVISLSQGRPDRSKTLLMLTQIIVLAPGMTSVGIISVYLYRSKPEALALWAVLLVIGLLAYRAYAWTLRQHKVLDSVYQFSRLVEERKSTDALIRPALDRVRALLNARFAVLGLWLDEDAGEMTFGLVSADDSVGADERTGPDMIERRALHGGGAVLVAKRNGTEKERAALEARGVDEIIVAPLRAGAKVIGCLEVVDRQAKNQAFVPADVQLVETLASHFGAAVENQRLMRQLRHDAYHDRLTGLPNRTRFMTAIGEAMAGASESSEVVGIVLFGLNTLKEVNDSLGHDAGDELVLAVGRRVRAQAPPDSCAARVGGDVFAIVLRDDRPDAITERARALQARICQPCEISGVTIEIGVSAGIAVWPTHADNAATLLRRADVAVDAARNSGQPVASYLTSMDQSSLYRLQLVTDLRPALAAGQMTVRYQPKLSLATREVIGVEALVRWEHPEYGEIRPDEFIPLAEQTGLIGALTTHVLGAALRQCRAWLDRDLRIGVAVNLSVRSLLDRDFTDHVVALLAAAEVPAELLTFEITENNVMADPERALPVLHHLHELGIGLSVDDFGTGYSSLAYLRRLPVDEVKIDKSFVLGMGTDLGDLAIVRAIIELCHSLGLRVVAEGVEEELGRDLLEGMECDQIQGYLVSRPVRLERLEAWLAARTVPRPAVAGISGQRLRLSN